VVGREADVRPGAVLAALGLAQGRVQGAGWVPEAPEGPARVLGGPRDALEALLDARESPGEGQAPVLGLRAGGNASGIVRGVPTTSSRRTSFPGT